MMKGIQAAGDAPIACREDDYYQPQFSVAVFYGLSGRLKNVFRDYQEEGRKAVYIDLGYWGRRDGGGRYNGYHKISVNGRHPTSYFQKHHHGDDRIRKFGLKAQPWRRNGRAILVAGMSAKASGVEGFKAEEWERSIIEKIKKVSDRPIIYRPKPSWKDAKEIEGTRYSPPEEDLEAILHGCWAVVTHHSNVAVDGLVLGIPSFCWAGVAKPMSSKIIEQIEKPIYPDGRDQWLSDIAYTQWNTDEIAKGRPWRHLKNEGLLP